MLQPGGKWITETRTDYVSRDAVLFAFWTGGWCCYLTTMNSDGMTEQEGRHGDRQTDRQRGGDRGTSGGLLYFGQDT